MRELEIHGCRTYVCPNISLIDVKGKELSLKDGTIKRAKELAIKYFKDTYSRPHYSHAKYLLPSFICIASIMEGDYILQKKLAKVFGTTNATIVKWNRDIIETMDLPLECSSAVKYRKGIRRMALIVRRYDIDIHPDLDLIDEGGKILGSDFLVIKNVKDLATRYFHNASLKYNKLPTTKTILPSLFYLVYIIRNDRRNQIDIAMKFNVSESHISVWYKDIINVLNIKIVYGFDRKVLRIIEEKDDL